MDALALLIRATALPPVAAKAIACEVAILNNFLWSDCWMFRTLSALQEAAPCCRRLFRFNGVCFVGLGLNVASFQGLSRSLGLNVYVANAIAIGSVAVFTYALTRRWAWPGG